MEYFGGALRKKLLIKGRAEAFDSKGFKKLCCNITSAAAQDGEITIGQVMLLAATALTQVIFHFRLTRRAKVQMFLITSFEQVSSSVSDVGIGA